MGRASPAGVLASDNAEIRPGGPGLDLSRVWQGGLRLTGPKIFDHGFLFGGEGWGPTVGGVAPGSTGRGTALLVVGAVGTGSDRDRQGLDGLPACGEVGGPGPVGG